MPRSVSLPVLLLVLLAVALPAPSQQTQQRSGAAGPASTAGLLEFLAAYGAGESYDALRNDLARYVAADGGESCLDATRTLLEQPAAVVDFSSALTDALRDAGAARDLVRMSGRSASLLGLDPLEAADAAAEPRTLDDAVARIEAASDLCEQAFAALPDAVQESLGEAAPALVADFVRHIYVHRKEGNRAVWESVRAVDWRALHRAAALLAPLTTPAFAAAVREEVRTSAPSQDRPEGVDGRLLHARRTRAGWLLVGGEGKNTYDLPCAFVLDLGGDDTYSGRATASSRSQRVNLVVDAGGDDIHRATSDGAQGCGRFGVSLLVDHGGDDDYRAARLAQGASLFGIGVLADYGGRDTYSGDAFVQGAGAFGCGLLLDTAGDDRMEAHLASQAFAWPMSTGFLVDLGGADERVGTGKYPSSYGTEGQYNGMCQGVSFGFRTLACGGFGVLVDGGGDDVSRAGEFGHGCGYYFGTGIVRDYGGDDRVEASRYGIATGAHFGVGAVLDDAGDDVWRNPSVAAIAGNWDLSVACFVDRAGTDRYEAGGLAIGCSTITSFAAFFDLGGEDTYVCGSRQAFGRAGHAEDARRGTVSVALFADLGGAKDAYPEPRGGTPQDDTSQGLEVEHARENGGAQVVGRGVFVDG